MTGKPKKVNVGPFRYTIAWVEDLPESSGFTNMDHRIIGVAGSCDEQTQRETLLHEILHAVIDMTGLRGEDKDKEEKLVASISPVLYDVLRSNPTVVAYLLDTPER